jgi:hypothetical protein
MAVCTRRAANPVVGAQGPWGSRRIVEGIGFGALTHSIEKLKSHKPSVGEAQAVIRQVLEEMAPHEFQIRRTVIGSTAGHEEADRSRFRFNRKSADHRRP